MSDPCYDMADRRTRSLTDSLAYLLYASILLGVPAALTLAWHGKLGAFVALLATMAVIAIVSSQGFEVFGSDVHGKAGMALVIVGPWALGISVATGFLGWILYARGEARREKQESDEDLQ